MTNHREELVVEHRTSSKSGKRSLFDSPSKYGVHHSISAFTPTEERFRWQNTTNSTDALYKLPSTIAGPKKGFGTSTREDWDVTKKKTNPCAGPGSYEAIGSCCKQPSSIVRSAPVTAFENAPRSPLQSDTTPSPGPIYELPQNLGLSPSCKFGTSQRPALNGKREGPGPNIDLKGSFKESLPGASPTFGTEKRLRASTAASSSPGPIYHLDMTGFRTGATFSFSNAKRF